MPCLANYSKAVKRLRNFVKLDEKGRRHRGPFPAAVDKVDVGTNEPEDGRKGGVFEGPGLVKLCFPVLCTPFTRSAAVRLICVVRLRGKILRMGNISLEEGEKRNEGRGKKIQ